MDDPILLRAAERLQRARAVIEALDLFGRWSAYGRPVLVGATAYELLVAPDIDMEIFCPRPHVDMGFRIVSELARLPDVWKVRFSNELAGPDQGLYWQLRYREHVTGTETVWNVDMWLFAEDHPGPLSADLVAPMRAALTPETRVAILRIKEALQGQEGVHGIEIYRAVLDGGVRTPAEFAAWRERHPLDGLTNWRPGTGQPSAGA